MAIDRQGAGLTVTRICVGVFFVFEALGKLSWLRRRSRNSAYRMPVSQHGHGYNAAIPYCPCNIALAIFTIGEHVWYICYLSR